MSFLKVIWIFIFVSNAQCFHNIDDGIEGFSFLEMNQENPGWRVNYEENDHFKEENGKLCC